MSERLEYSHVMVEACLYQMPQQKDISVFESNILLIIYGQMEIWKCQ